MRIAHTVLKMTGRAGPVLAAGALLTLAAGCKPADADSQSAQAAPDTAAAQTGALAQADEGAPNTLTAAEQAAGWRLLWDGKDFEGWRGLGYDSVPTQHWKIVDGTIYKVPTHDVPLMPDGQPVRGGDLMTKDTFKNFELEWDWKISEAGNSGLKYNVSEELSTKRGGHDALGFEYQMLDDSKHPDGKLPTHRSGALYDLIPPPADKDLKPVGEWNHARVVFNGNHGEHWLNGKKTVEYELGSPEMAAAFAKSKWHNNPDFITRKVGHIVLQDHTDAVWIRNIKIHELP
jgi:hypothetical protein